MRALSNIPSAPSAPPATLDHASGHPPPSAGDVDNRRPDLVGFWPVAQVPIATTDEAPPPIAVATYASARQKLCRAPLDGELARNRWIRRMEGSANRPTLRM